MTSWLLLSGENAPGRLPGLASSIEEDDYDGCNFLMPAGAETSPPSIVPGQSGLSVRGNNVFE